jgi:hypothetical protein
LKSKKLSTAGLSPLGPDFHRFWRFNRHDSEGKWNFAAERK